VHVPTLLARAGISEADLKDKSARVPVARELALWRAADELTGDPALGLRLAAQFEPGVLGSLGYMLRHSQNLAQLLAQLPKPHGLVEAARASLRSGLGQRKATPDELARALHLSERTLRRRLALEGTSYQALLDEVRRALALTLVLRSDLSFAQMAEQLGFADASTYYRAFKRWTGTTPREYQKQRGE
jgi:AraC-like DNA-binding protein